MRRACQLLGISRRWLGYQGVGEDRKVVEVLLDLAQRYPRWGYRLLHQKLLRELAKLGRKDAVNVKRVRRLCQVHGLTLLRKRPKKRRGMGTAVPCWAEYPNHVWAYDFVFDACADGRVLKILTIQDEFTREGLDVVVEHRLGARGVAKVLLRLFAERGTPVFVRSDNGPEFIARALVEILAAQGVTCRHITPGSPWQNGKNERFNGTLRNECLNLETFAHRDQARALCRLYLRVYNTERPHSALGYRTPAEFARRPGAAASAPGLHSGGPPPRPQPQVAVPS